MALSWNEIRTRATAFTKEWENETSEDAEAKSFWDGFFNIFGIPRKRIGSFEVPVKKGDQSQGFIDLLWRGVILVEHKSRGRDLDKAFTQAKEYFPGLKDADLPKYILVSDFARFRLYDLETGEKHEFLLEELPKKVDFFGFIAGYQKRVFAPEDPVNTKAAELMGKLHDSLKDIGYTGHELEVYLVRILFCLFAEDTSIFDKKLFQEYIEQKTKIDGSDLASALQGLFEILNTPEDKRFTNLDESLAAFPYINGKLFEENLRTASFDSTMRDRLLACCVLDWSGISPAVFGSLFQSVMDEKARRNLGAHYTSETNIMKLISPLFLDELWEEFHKSKRDKKKLEQFHIKLSRLTFLDPACGCGNFLVVTYRELRKLEIEVIKILLGDQQILVDPYILISVDQFYGIEIEEFPSQIATVAMWLVDHQMNMAISNQFGQYFRRIPLTHRATIVHGNALQTDWKTIIAPERLSYIIGNPPFLGYKLQSAEQKKDMENIFGSIHGAGVMDFVCAWYKIAGDYIQKTNIKVAFVSTNSIVQGEHVGILWKELVQNMGIKIHFAHQTFKWSNDAKGNAGVYCVIIGFANFDIKDKRLFIYDSVISDPHQVYAKNINSYLIDSRDIFIEKRRKPISRVPILDYGSEPREGGFLLLSSKERLDFINKYPSLHKYIKRFISSDDYINNNFRYCFWLLEVPPEDIKLSQELLQRLDNVRKFRQNSLQKQALLSANTPTLFTSIRQPHSDYLLIPIVSSENRKYIPIGYVSKDVIVSNACFSLSGGGLYHFAILTSNMHMSWVRAICGRLESRYRYSNTIVYNNFPWPEINEKSTKKIEELAQAVLDARLEFPESSLADLYDPRTMPPSLVHAHTDLDHAVDKLYKPTGFKNDSERVQWLFGMWENLTQ